MALWFLFFLGIGGRSIFSCVDALNIKVRRHHLFSCFSRYHFLKLMLVVYLHSTCGTWHYIMPLHLYRLCCSFLCLLSSQKIASHSSDLFATRMLMQLMFDIWLKKMLCNSADCHEIIIFTVQINQLFTCLQEIALAKQVCLLHARVSTSFALL